MKRALRLRSSTTWRKVNQDCYEPLVRRATWSVAHSDGPQDTEEEMAVNMVRMNYEEEDA